MRKILFLPLFVLCLWINQSYANTTKDLLEADALYFNGDYKAALYIWLPLAKEGNAKAQFSIVKLHYEEGLFKNISRANKIIDDTLKVNRAEAQSGNKETQAILAYLYFLKNPEKKPFQAIKRWTRNTINQYKKFAERGNAEAQYQLGKAYLEGFGVKQENSTAGKWLKLAAQQGHPIAQYKIANLYLEQNNNKKAIQWLEKSAKLGYGLAQHTLGSLYFNANQGFVGKYYQQNFKQAAKAYGLMTKNLTNNDDRLARLQSFLNPSDAKFVLGMLHLSGDGVPRDYRLAEKILQAVAENGRRDVQFYLGKLYEIGTANYPPDYKEAVRWYGYSLKKNNHDTTNDKSTLRKLEHLSGSPHEALYLLGLLNEYGQGGFKENFADALTWYNKAAQADYAQAEYTIGRAYESGRHVTQDLKLAAEWYYKAITKEHAPSQYRLGLLYYYGKGVVQDYNQTIKWYSLAAKQGYPQAQYALGSLYTAGTKGVLENSIKAAEWWRLAAQQGTTEAQYVLANAYAKGEGVTQSYINAYMWMALAKANGKEEAKQVLENVKGKLSSQELQQAQQKAETCFNSGFTLCD